VEPIIAVTVGVLFACGLFMVLRRNLLKLVIGLVLISNAANLTIFAAGRMTRGTPALIPEGAELPPVPFANPLPQALILTAIVIGFGLVAFAFVLVYRAYQELGTMNSDDLHTEGDRRPSTTARKRDLQAEILT
jgi:multicomponent Na+:H+ antiporter subunit C